MKKDVHIPVVEMESTEYGMPAFRVFIDSVELIGLIGVQFKTQTRPKGLPDGISFSVDPQSITDAISVLRHELLQHGEIYRGFKASLKSALEHYNCCGLPFEPEEEIAGKMLDFIIGEEK